jgi:hypothetical protein
MSLAKQQVPQDINVTSGLAAALYLGGRELDQVISLTNAEEELVTHFENVARASILEPAIKEELKKRYLRIHFINQLRLGYLWAQRGLQDSYPPEEIPWLTVLNEVEAARKQYIDKQAPLFRCTDEGFNFIVGDIYAYVTLAFEASRTLLENMAAAMRRYDDIIDMRKGAFTSKLPDVRADHVYRRRQ